MQTISNFIEELKDYLGVQSRFPSFLGKTSGRNNQSICRYLENNKRRNNNPDEFFKNKLGNVIFLLEEH